MARNKDWNWGIGEGPTYSWDAATLAVLMDLRDELKALNRIVGCDNAIDIPNILRRIDTNTKKVARKRKK